MTVMNMSNAIQCLKIHVEHKVPVWLWGPSGIGKTEIPHQLVKELGPDWNIIDWRANLHDPVDAHGLPVPDLVNNVTNWLAPSTLPIGGRFGKKGILLLDEINTASIAMQNACLQMALEGRVGEHKLDNDWVCVATGNRAKDKAHVSRVSTALKNRFAHIEIEPDVDAWTKWALTNGVDKYLIAFMRFRRELLHKAPIDDNQNAFPSPRQWVKAARYLGHSKELRLHLISSVVGHEAAIECEGFLRVINDLPTLDEVLKSPDSAKVPSDPSAKYAITSMLAHGANRKTFKPILQYAARLDREFEVLAAVDAVRLHPELANTPDFGIWAVKHQDVTL